MGTAEGPGKVTKRLLSTRPHQPLHVAMGTCHSILGQICNGSRPQAPPQHTPVPLYLWAVCVWTHAKIATRSGEESMRMFQQAKCRLREMNKVTNGCLATTEPCLRQWQQLNFALCQPANEKSIQSTELGCGGSKTGKHELDDDFADRN